MSPSTIILITGANSGIGLAAAEVIASSSSEYHVIIASRNAGNGEAAIEQVKASGSVKGSLSSVQLDVNDPSSIANAAKQVEKEFGRLDVLINNAGIAMMDGDEHLEDSLTKTLRTNTIGPVLMIEAFRPLLLKSKRAYSIYVSSGLGSLGIAQDLTDPHSNTVNAFAYRMSKAALNMWVVQEDRIWTSRGIKSFVICPGFVVSNLRGKTEDARNPGGAAGDPKVSGQILLDIVEGKRDADAGKFVWEKGVYPW